MIAARRVRTHSALFVALACVCALLAGVVTGLVGELDSAALDGVRSGIAQLRGAQAQLRFDAPTAADPARQNARAAAIIARELRRGAGGGSVPVTITRTRADDGDDTVWTVRADAARLTPADLAVLARAGTRIHEAMLDDPAVGAEGVEKSGSLDAQAKALAARIAPLAGIQPVPLLLVAAIGVVTLAELARLLDGVRLRETALLRSRGASAARVGRTTAVEALVVAGGGAVVGAAAATGALLAFGRHPLGGAALASIVLAVVAVAIALVAGVAYNSARAAFRRDTADDSGRARRLAAPGLLVLLVAAAALSLWRYLQFGSPLSPTSAGTAVDPIAVLAPALCLAAIAVVCLAAFAPAARLTERLAARGAGARLALLAGQLARRSRMTASPIVLIALAGGGLVVAACYTPTWQAAAARTAALHAGSDLVVTGASATDAAAISRLHGVRAAAPVSQFSWQADSGQDVTLSALGLPRIRTTVSPADGAVDPAALAHRVGARLLGDRVPADATGLEVAIDARGFAPTLAAYVVDADGLAVRETVSVAADGVGRAPLPAGPGRRLVALEVDVPRVSPDVWNHDAPQISFRVTGVSAVMRHGATRPLSVSAWQANPSDGSSDFSAALTPDGPLGFHGLASPSGSELRFAEAGTQQVHVAVSAALATASHARLGTRLTFDLSGSAGGSMTATVAAIEPQVPGAQGEAAVFAELAALQTQRIMRGYEPLALDRVWVRASSPRDAAAAIEKAVPGARVTGPAIAPGSRVLASVPVALWLGVAGGAALALIALAAVAGELLRLRAEEVAVLRALGMAPRTLARLRQWELVAVCVAAAVGAAASGAIASALLVPGLARVAIASPFAHVSEPLRLDLVGLGAAAVAMAGGIAAVVAVYGSRVAQQARTAIAREGTR